ncbi:MAG: hypothetical protein M3464_03115 [Chloroflexota bacterium]|nr:hypothetical protein [Chloroflexota bacterium]
MPRPLFIALAAMLTIVLAGPIAGIAQEATPAADSATTGLVRTDVRHLLPYGLDGLNPELSVVSEDSGVCAHESLSIPGRPDAWDCIGGDSSAIYDPCFADPFMIPDELGDLVCVDSPFSTEIVRFTLTEPLSREKDVDDPMAAAMPGPAGPGPAAGSGPPVRPGPGVDMPGPPAGPMPAAVPEEADPEHWDLPWALELANGERCTLLTGATAAFAGDRLNYGCENGGYVLGEVNQERPVWVVSYLADGAFATTLVEVVAAWA